MTIPETLLFPEFTESTASDPLLLQKFNRELVRTLSKSYEDIAGEINGILRNSVEVVENPYIPTINDTAPGGSFAFDYVHQYGWVLRQGLFVDVWFDVSWNNGVNFGGNLYLELPYKVATLTTAPTEKLFVGALQVDSLSYTGDYCVINAIPNSRRGEIWECTTAAADANVAFEAAGQIMGHIRYVGVGIERD